MVCIYFSPSTKKMETQWCILHGLKDNNKALGIISSLPLANQSCLGFWGAKPLNNKELQVNEISKFWQAISAQLLRISSIGDITAFQGWRCHTKKSCLYGYQNSSE